MVGHYYTIQTHLEYLIYNYYELIQEEKKIKAVERLQTEKLGRWLQVRIRFVRRIGWLLRKRQLYCRGRWRLFQWRRIHSTTHRRRWRLLLWPQKEEKEKEKRKKEKQISRSIWLWWWRSVCCWGVWTKSSKSKKVKEK